MTLDQALSLVQNEIKDAEGRFPSIDSAYEGYAAILEKLDDLWERIKDNSRLPYKDWYKIQKEAAGLAATAVWFLMDVFEDPEK